MKYDLLVNKDNPIDENFIVEKLVSVGKVFDDERGGFTDTDILLEEETAASLRLMLDEVNSKFSDVYVFPDSGYRDYQSQEHVLKYYIEKEGLEKALQRVASPGTSEHQTGLAIDIAILYHGKYIDDVSGDEDAIRFLHQNAYKYGFILRYPKNKVNITKVMYEPWHFRFVGKELAQYLHENDLSLEEYYILIKDKSKSK